MRFESCRVGGPSSFIARSSLVALVVLAAGTDGRAWPRTSAVASLGAAPIGSGTADLVLTSGFEEGEGPAPRDCIDDGGDLDGDGLLDPGCIVDFVPNDPSLVAPPLDQTLPADFVEVTEFLYEGPNPIQRLLRPDTLQPYRLAIARGRVKDDLGQPLPGVLVRVLDHPEYGYTITRADGMFDLAVNGGGAVTVDYRRAGYLRAQRTTELPWRDWQWFDDTTLIPLDATVTPVNFDATVPAQVARGSVVSDEDGSRQATVVFQPGTLAQLVMHDGSTVPLPQIHFRANGVHGRSGGSGANAGNASAGQWIHLRRRAVRR